MATGCKIPVSALPSDLALRELNVALTLQYGSVYYI